MELTKYQLAILEYIRNESGNVYIDAVAGSGKTTMLQLIANKLSPFENSLFIAFNRHIKDAMVDRVPANVNIKTVHGLGYSFLMNTFNTKVKMDEQKYLNIARREAYKYNIPQTQATVFAKEVSIILSYARSLMTGPTKETIANICKTYNIDLVYFNQVVEAAPDVLLLGIKAAHDIIDFTDMIFIPVIYEMKSNIDYQSVLVDEAQDISTLQLRFIKSIQKENTRFVFVGDRNQSIYGFAGVLSTGTDTIIDYFNTKVLKLPICYRCPPSHIVLANHYTNREILPAEGRETGTLKGISEYEIFEKVKPGDLVLCRYTAPLIRLCMDLNARGIKSWVRNSAFMDDLLILLTKIEDYTNALNLREEPLSELLDRFYDYYVFKCKPTLSNVESWIARLEDKLASIEAISTYYGSTDFIEIAGNIKDFLKEPSDLRVCLSSIHKAKGLEADRVFIIRPDLLPSKLAYSAEEIQQERNLTYVALTRAKKELYICGAD